MNVTSNHMSLTIGLFLMVLGRISYGQHFTSALEEANLQHLTENNGQAIADYDQDGDLDIFMVAKKSFDPEDQSTWSRLLSNDGNGAFEDVTIAAGFGTQYTNPGLDGSLGQKMGAAWGDYNNDGYPDLLLTHFRKVELYRNNGDGTFSDVTENSGIRRCPECYNSSALWWDYDNDGDVDLYISDWQKANRMYRNESNGSFTDITKDTGLGDIGNTWTSVPIDVNRDGWLDIYVVNDFYKNRFYINRNGEYFEELTETYGLENTGEGMGVTTGDYNNDGLFDIYMTNIYKFNHNPLYTGTVTGKYDEFGSEEGVENAGWAWGTHFFDCDHDGDEDIYVANGYKWGPDTNRLFRNMREEGNEEFINWSEESQTNGDQHGMSMEVFDYDQDGDLDILVANTDTIPYLYRNETISNNQPGFTNWLQVSLEGTTSNRDGIGAILELWTEGRSFHRFYHGAALLAQSLQPVHFGLKDTQIVDSLIVNWPSGIQDVLYNISANQNIEVIEQSTSLPSVTSILDDLSRLSAIKLNGNYPNPMTHKTNFDLEINEPGLLTLTIFSTTGQQVYNSREFIPATGNFTLTWLSDSTDNTRILSGFYVYQIEFEGDVLRGKLIVKK